jgi:GDP-4-dehydro-6-deoxy-D-mannose reductase
MKALITGADGFIGSHLADFLLDKNMEIYATVYSGKKNIEHLENKINLIECDITDRKKLDEIISEVRPDYVFHMAAQSFVVPSWKDPEETLKTNILGTFYLLDAIRKAGVNPIIAIACSSAEYGLNYEDEIPINEKKEFRPSSPYAVSKIGTDMLAYLYFQAYKMKVLRIRFFNVIGPRKIFDACSDFGKGIAEIEKGIKEKLSVGNLNGIRDLTDVRDAIEAVWLLTEKGEFGDVYNICTGKRYKVKEILDKFISMAKTEIVTEQDPAKARILDDPIFIGDNFKISKLGWSPKTPVEKSLGDILDYWRAAL